MAPDPSIADRIAALRAARERLGTLKMVTAVGSGITVVVLAGTIAAGNGQAATGTTQDTNAPSAPTTNNSGGNGSSDAGGVGGAAPGTDQSGAVPGGGAQQAPQQQAPPSGRHAPRIVTAQS